MDEKIISILNLINQRKLMEAKRILILLDEIGEKFYYHSDIDGISLKLNELEEFKELKQKLKGASNAKTM